MKASIIIPTHNRKEELQNTLESIVEQTYEEKEVVVVSDSDDGTNQLFAEGNEFDEPWIEFHDIGHRIGIAKALNIGIEEADGDLVVTLDDDSYFADTGGLREVIDTFDQTRTSGSSGCVWSTNTAAKRSSQAGRRGARAHGQGPVRFAHRGPTDGDGNRGPA